MRVHYKKIHGGDIPRRPKAHAVRIPGSARIPVQLQGENLVKFVQSSQIEENVKSEKPEDDLEKIVIVNVEGIDDEVCDGVVVGVV